MMEGVRMNDARYRMLVERAVPSAFRVPVFRIQESESCIKYPASSIPKPKH